MELKSNILVLPVILTFFCSCNYHYYSIKDKVGAKQRFREYNSYDLQERYTDKMMVKLFYKFGEHEIDSTCISKSDTSVNCDSILILIHPDSRKYSSLFTKGILSCRFLSSMYEQRWPMAIDSEGKEIVDTTPKTLIVRNLEILDFIRRDYSKRIFKFKITPYTYYLELTNGKVGRKAKYEEFIENGRLSWFFRSNVIEI